MSHIVNLITNELHAQQRTLAHCQNQIKQFPPGYLIQQESKRGHRLYWVEPVSNVPKKKDYHRLHENDYEIAKAIRDKFLFEKECKVYENNISCMNEFLNKYQPCDEETILGQMDEPYRSLGGLKPIDSEKFTHSPCVSENPFYREYLIHRNSIGELFRSKSEALISELLLTNQIPYRYEQKLTINGETKYPDFTITVPGANRRKYIEYFGRMDDSGYTETLAERINWYLNRKLLQGRDTLFLFENSRSGIDLILVWEQIESFLKN